ncbi:uncharacterized protein LOC113350554 [Papaver somniferum]|uniref:uncharacterized protein LOC113350554 n=1 Tax=Papaver somniferum TaxID=3469 RepID=UPI000E6FDD7D|nr:uncharacterized protein LOC113350554 [Papaver somniferum]
MLRKKKRTEKHKVSTVSFHSMELNSDLNSHTRYKKRRKSEFCYPKFEDTFSGSSLSCFFVRKKFSISCMIRLGISNWGSYFFLSMFGFYFSPSKSTSSIPESLDFYRQGIYWETSQHPAHVRIGFDTVEKLKFEFENCFIMEAASWHRRMISYRCFLRGKILRI